MLRRRLRDLWRVPVSAVSFSARTSFDLAENRLSAAAASLRRSGARLLDLTTGNPTAAGIPYPDAIVQAFADPALLRYAPDPLGTAAAREAVAAALARRGVPADPGRILLTASTSEAYSYLLRLLCDPGDDVLVPAPSYPLLEYLARLDHVVARPWPLVYAGEWLIDLEAVRAAVGPRTRAVLLVSPNNPTGSYVHPAELRALAALAAERGLALIVDEVFADYAFDDAFTDRYLTDPGEALLFGLGGLSKAAGLPQMKLGWTRVCGPPALVSAALERLEVIADTFLSVGTPVQVVLPTLLRAGDEVQQAILARVRDNRAVALALLEGSVASILHADGGWYAVLQVPRALGDEEWALTLLEQDGVLVQPGWFFDFAREGHLIVSLLTHPDVLREGLVLLRARLETVCD